MKFAYADPPYLGCASYYDHPESRIYDTPEAHRDLIGRLVAEFPDGWVMSLSAPSLRTILPMCPEDCRVGAWTKPFASFKPGVNPGYCWEPVVFRGGRKRGRGEATVRDFCAVNITMRRGFCGAKPDGFCRWVFDLLGLEKDDEFHDLFPGSGAVGRAWVEYRLLLSRCQPLSAVTPPLFEETSPVSTPKTKKPVVVPEWVRKACACPVCGEAMHRTISRDYVACRAVPAHTGLLRFRVFLTTLLLAEKQNSTGKTASKLSAAAKRAALKVLERHIPMSQPEEGGE